MNYHSLSELEKDKNDILDTAKNLKALLSSNNNIKSKLQDGTERSVELGKWLGKSIYDIFNRRENAEYAGELIPYNSYNTYKEIKELVAKGANLNYKDPITGETLLTKCILTDHLEILSLLLMNGADVNLENDAGVTPLMVISKYNCTEILSRLIAYGADLNKQDKDGMTALMIATQYGNSDMVQKLIILGSNVNLERNNGDTALMIAAKLDNQECFDLLVKAQSHLLHINKDGETILDIPTNVKFDKSLLEEYKGRLAYQKDEKEFLNEVKEQMKQLKLEMSKHQI